MRHRRSGVGPAIWLLVAVMGCGSDETPSNGGGAGGAAGTGGSGGTAGTAGAAGDGGTGGATGGTGGTGGIAGEAGAAGAGGTGATSPWPEGCLHCHGSDGNPAPPVDLEGNDATTFPGVGAHRAHLGDGTWHQELACSECHGVPSVATWDPAVPSHMNGVNDLVWGPLAQSGTYDETDNTCANTYCHGATLGPDASGSSSNRAPSWVVVDGSQTGCGTACHTLPPGGSHSPSTDCAACHGSVIASMTAGSPPTVDWADPSLHINGTVELQGMSCTGCHGDPSTGDPAPPVGTHGETETSEPAVGAHQAHLASSSWHRDGTCADCHTMPGSMSHANGTTDFAWGAPANADGAAPAYGTDNKCTNVYCHGATLGAGAGGTNPLRTPTWTTVDGSQDSCGNACHTLPPGGSHPNMEACNLCHGSTITAIDVANPSAATWNNKDQHINGSVDY